MEVLKSTRPILSYGLLLLILKSSAYAFPVRFQGVEYKAKPSFLENTQSLRVFDPYERVEIDFEGYPLSGVMDQVFGKSWRALSSTHQLRMRCKDGYQARIPLDRILKHTALIAIRRRDQGGFTLLKKDITPEKTVELAPAYLVWENLKDPIIRAEGDYGWPFQWEEATLEPLGSGDSLPLPQAGAPRAAIRGFTHFKVHCVKCHSLSGEGGKVGPELNAPMNVTRYWRKQMLIRWILDPAAFRIPNGMPPIAPAHPDRKTLAREIVAYLENLPSHKERK